jgi:hypothetical protein
MNDIEDNSVIGKMQNCFQLQHIFAILFYYSKKDMEYNSLCLILFQMGHK